MFLIVYLFYYFIFLQPCVEKKRVLEILPEASPVKQRELSAEEVKILLEGEEIILRELRLYLRGVTWKLLADRKYKEFSKPVDPEEVRLLRLLHF